MHPDQLVSKAETRCMFLMGLVGLHNLFSEGRLYNFLFYFKEL